MASDNAGAARVGAIYALGIFGAFVYFWPGLIQGVVGRAAMIRVPGRERVAQIATPW